MEARKNLCRLCFVKMETGVDLFRKPRKKSTYSHDLINLLQISLEERSEWPTNACEHCIDFLCEIKSFKEKVESTQETLLNVTPDTKPIEDVFFDNAPEAEEPPKRRGRKKKIKEEISIKIECDEIPTPPAPSRRTSRTPKKRPVCEDVVTTFRDDDSDSDAETYGNATESAAAKRRKAAQEEEEDKSYICATEKRDRKTRQLPDDTLTDYAGADEEDRIIKREKRTTSSQRRLRLPFEAQEEKRKLFKASLEKKYAKYAYLVPQMRELKMNVCALCEEVVDTLPGLYCHQEREHGISRYQGYALCCNIKHGIYTAFDHVLFHQDKDAFTCPECGKKCRSKYNLKKHSVVHKPEEQKNHHCSKCGKGFNERNCLVKHEKKHRIYKFDCDECKEMFLTPDFLQNHIDFTHRNIPRHICDICGKGFKGANQLTSHRKSHTKIRTVTQCDVCGLYFIDVATHKKRTHTSNAVPCSECGKQLNPAYLKKHMNTVHRIGTLLSYDCSICKRQFKTSDSLKYHMAIHLGIRYPCHFCSETYGAIRNRLKHMQTKHAVEYASFKVQQNMEKLSKYKLAQTDGGNGPVPIQVLVATPDGGQFVIEHPPPAMSVVAAVEEN